MIQVSVDPLKWKSFNRSIGHSSDLGLFLSRYCHYYVESNINQQSLIPVTGMGQGIPEPT